MEETRQTSLQTFLTSAFGVGELERLLQSFGPEGADLGQQLPNPQSSSLANYTYGLVDGLVRRQLVDAEFFARLTDLRPRRAPEIRDLAGLWSVALPQPSSQVRLLFLGASAFPEWDFKISDEIEAIRTSLQRSDYGTRFTLKTVERADQARFWEETLLYRPHILHFAGHAQESGELFVHGTHGHATLPLNALLEFFAALRPDLQCMTFNACNSVGLARRIADTFGCTIGIVGNVSNGSCIGFSQQFYLALSHGRSIRSAFSFARSFVLAAHRNDADRFQIFHSPAVDPDAVRFAG